MGREVRPWPGSCDRAAFTGWGPHHPQGARRVPRYPVLAWGVTLSGSRGLRPHPVSPVFHVGAGGWRRGAQRVGALSPQHPLLLPPGGPFLPSMLLLTHRHSHPSMSLLPLPSPTLSGDTPPHAVSSPAGSPFSSLGAHCPGTARFLSQMPSSSSDLLFSPGAPSFPGCPHRPPRTLSPPRPLLS